MCIPAACTFWLHTFTYGNKTQKKFTGLFAPCRPFSEPLEQSGSVCRAQHCLKTGVGVESLTLFIAFSSCLVLAHCFCHAHLHLPVISYPSPFFYISFTPLLSSIFLSSLLCFLRRHLPVRFYEYRRVSFKSKDMGAVGQARKAADTPLPDPEQLLNLRNRIISAKVAALFHSQEHGKQTERVE